MGTSDLYSNDCDSEPNEATWRAAVENAVSDGIFIDACSCNYGSVTKICSPACLSNVTSVGMTYDEDRAGIFSWDEGECNDTNPTKDYIACRGNRNSLLDLLAPGVLILSTNVSGDYYDEAGTSFSAPHVAGAAALLIQYEKLRNNRTLTPHQIEERLKDTGKLIYDNGDLSTSEGSNLTFPRIDAYSALFPIDVYDLDPLRTAAFNNIFSFKIQNHYNNKTKDIYWTFDLGNGTQITSEENISLLPGNSTFVFIEYNYDSNGSYTV